MNRTIRLFVSSTFSDFKAERDLMQREGFPKLQHRLDENAVPAEYVLKPRTGQFEDFPVWQAEVERPLLAGFADAIQSDSPLRASAPPRETLAIGLSATHQEIRLQTLDCGLEAYLRRMGSVGRGPCGGAGAAGSFRHRLRLWRMRSPARKGLEHDIKMTFDMT